MPNQSGILPIATETEEVGVTGPVRLYWSAQHAGQWIAHAGGIGWVIFPARPNGWEERRKARGLDPMHVREVPLGHAWQTGLPGASQNTGKDRAA
jgi:hypothetical protein